MYIHTHVYTYAHLHLKPSYHTYTRNMSALVPILLTLPYLIIIWTLTYKTWYDIDLHILVQCSLTKGHVTHQRDSLAHRKCLYTYSNTNQDGKVRLCDITKFIFWKCPWQSHLPWFYVACVKSRHCKQHKAYIATCPSEGAHFGGKLVVDEVGIAHVRAEKFPVLYIGKGSKRKPLYSFMVKRSKRKKWKKGSKYTIASGYMI